MEDLFYSEQHRNFYRLHVDGGADPYYRALVYLLGMTEETRANFSRCFDGEARMIRPAALGEGWQTGGTARIVRMASYFYEAVKLRYTEYTDHPRK